MSTPKICSADDHPLPHLIAQLNQAVDVKEAGNLLLEAIHRIHPVRRSGVVLLEPEEIRHPVLLAYPAPDRGITRTSSLRLSDIHFARINQGWQTANEIFTQSELQRMEDVVPDDALFFPLRGQRRLQGLVWISPPPAAEEERKNIGLLCESAAPSLLYLRTQERLQEQRKHHHIQLLRRQQVAEGFRYILTILQSGRPLDEVLRYIISQAGWMLDTSMGALLRWQPDTGELEPQVLYGIPESSYRSVETAALFHAIYQNQVSVINHSSSGHRAERTEFRTTLVAPIFLSEIPYGCLVLYFDEARTFSQEEINLVLTFCEQAALAVENDHLRSRQAATMPSPQPKVSSPSPQLSEGENAVLNALLQGQDELAIMKSLHIPAVTLHFYQKRLLAKHNVHSLGELISRLRQK